MASESSNFRILCTRPICPLLASTWGDVHGEREKKRPEFASSGKGAEKREGVIFASGGREVNIGAKGATMSAQDAIMSAKGATMSAENATMRAEDATMNAKKATMGVKDATMSARDAMMRA